MKKIAKIALILIIAVVFLISSALILIATKINQETIKHEIVKVVHDKTGSDLKIDGDVQLSFFPRLGIKINDVTLESTKNKPAKAVEVIFSVKPLPLLSGRVTMGHLMIKKFNYDNVLSLSSIALDLDAIDKIYTLSNLKFTGKLSDKSIDFKGDADVEIDLKKQTLISQNLKLYVSGATITGWIRGNKIIDSPNFTSKLKIKKLEINKLEFGETTLGIDINIRGNNLNGRCNVLIDGGSYSGIDIPFEIRRADAILNQKPMPQEPSQPHTNFDSCTANFKIDNALFSTNDILIKSPDCKVTGQGSINVESKHLNLLLNAYSIHNDNFLVPIRISGHFDSPSIKPDLAVVTRQVIEKEIGKQLEKLNIPQELLSILPFGKT